MTAVKGCQSQSKPRMMLVLLDFTASGAWSVHWSLLCCLAARESSWPRWVWLTVTAVKGCQSPSKPRMMLVLLDFTASGAWSVHWSLLCCLAARESSWPRWVWLTVTAVKGCQSPSKPRMMLVLLDFTASEAWSMDWILQGCLAGQSRSRNTVVSTGQAAHRDSCQRLSEP